MTAAVRVLVIDDEQLVRKALTSELTEERGSGRRRIAVAGSQPRLRRRRSHPH